jgi:hypothetical protein
VVPIGLLETVIEIDDERVRLTEAVDVEDATGVIVPVFVLGADAEANVRDGEPVTLIRAVVGRGETEPEIIGDLVGLSELLKDPPRDAVKLACTVAVTEVVGVTNLLPLIDGLVEAEMLGRPVGLMLSAPVELSAALRLCIELYVRRGVRVNEGVDEPDVLIEPIGLPTPVELSRGLGLPAGEAVSERVDVDDPLPDPVELCTPVEL